MEIAKKHGLTLARKFNVRGRAGLTALWLGEIPTA